MIDFGIAKLDTADGSPGARYGHEHRPDSGHRRVHEPGTGARRIGRQTDGHLGVRLRALRDADGSAAVRRQDVVGHDRAHSRARAGVGSAAGRGSSRRSQAAETLPQQGSRRSSARHRRCTAGDRRRVVRVRRRASIARRRARDRGSAGCGWRWQPPRSITIATIWWALSRPAERTPPPPPVEFGVRFPDNHIPATGLAVSPDGRQIAVGVFGNASQIWLHSLDSSQTRPLAGTENAQFPFWSPDGARLGFSADGKLAAIDVAGGSPTVICELPLSAQIVFGAAWNTSGVIVFPVRNQLFKVQASGGVPTPIPLTGKIEPAFPQFLPDQRHFIFYDGAPSRRRIHPSRPRWMAATPSGSSTPTGRRLCAAQPAALRSWGGADGADDGPGASHTRRKSEARRGERVARRAVRLSSERVGVGDRSPGLRAGLEVEVRANSDGSTGQASRSAQ